MSKITQSERDAFEHEIALERLQYEKDVVNNHKYCLSREDFDLSQKAKKRDFEEIMQNIKKSNHEKISTLPPTSRNAIPRDRKRAD